MPEKSRLVLHHCTTFWKRLRGFHRLPPRMFASSPIRSLKPLTPLATRQSSPLSQTTSTSPKGANSTERHQWRASRVSSEVSEDIGMFLAPCWAIHTIGMQFPIDVVFVDASLNALRQVQCVPPNRVVWCWGAKAAIELPAGYCERHPDYLRRIGVALSESRYGKSVLDGVSSSSKVG